MDGATTLLAPGTAQTLGSRRCLHDGQFTRPSAHVHHVGRVFLEDGAGKSQKLRRGRQPHGAGAPAGVRAEEQGLGTQQSGLWGPRQAH